MKTSGTLACIFVGIDCAERALGSQPQVLFSANATWLWGVVAIAWLYWAFRHATA
jgi:hypothetical protein